VKNEFGRNTWGRKGVDQNILTCIAMGYPNEEFSANSVKSRRADLEDFVNFVGFD
jgi:hypothetical protein